CLQSKNSPRTF
nr:immunoglobulin light chain junction region [Macaca mulatta]MOW11839.1 immunoglobulin light chain junction region [Macaca mulatta]MOX08400.1 immunoglobulin light chain junction region [Macaca mulatta]MOX09660.1 immunoglobulin light chain junction region [Macaca mulatta]MOX10375.1 immunoglobulin light chain junction region [Macaca mulatta]